MLNEERIILMTQIASYEETEGKKMIPVGRYFRGDYVGLQVIKTVIHATIAFGLIAALFIFNDIGAFMQSLYKLEMLQVGRMVIIAYVIFIAIYAAIAYFVYSYRYNHAKSSLKQYYNNLKELATRY
ncbi:MAG: hypothetical protein RRX92_09115 [Lachnospiraceae bacterium]